MKNEDFKAVFEHLKSEDIEKYIKLAEEELDKRRRNRAKELWGNVVAVMRKYENEMENLLVLDRNGYEYEITVDIDDPGKLYIC